ncbi:YciI family protein [Hoyosella sp. YIM 151337]|uniref:YciI family protein n=1 Tax=Hoyosella sp. YIM 151337 TaxID=2992742 RepID=UPI002236126A|nr:YciI family protein [Hoyosella sp. YIM 151337]MCW4354314.1 YciI family protein [Hoyosella sp. YIM 151337]
MRFMSIVRANEANLPGPPPPELFEAMDKLAREERASGTLVDDGGLYPGEEAAIVTLAGGKISAVDGPYAEAKEVIGGYAIVDVRSREEAVEVARRFLQVHKDAWPGWEGTCEVRQVYEPEGPVDGCSAPRT